MAVVNVGEGFFLDLTFLNIGALQSGTTVQESATQLTLKFDAHTSDVFTGNFTYKNGVITGGTLTGMTEYIDGKLAFEMHDFSISIPTFMTMIRQGDTYGFMSAVLASDSTLTGQMSDDALVGGPGNDFIRGYDGNDVLIGGDGDDIILGDDGNDTIMGGNGNDTLWGGEGNDSLDGGNGDDFINGQEGNDWIYGGAGNDRLSGGPGADWFAFEKGNGHDEITDFNSAEGDRINLHKGQAYYLSEFEGSTIVTLASGDSVELIGVPMSKLGNWLVMT